MCKLLDNFSFWWTLPAVWVEHPWTDCVSNFTRSSLRSLFNIHLLYRFFFFLYSPTLPLFTPLISSLLSVADEVCRISAAALACPQCPVRVKTQRQDKRGIWTIVPLLIFLIIFCCCCTCSPTACPLPRHTLHAFIFLHLTAQTLLLSHIYTVGCISLVLNISFFSDHAFLHSVFSKRRPWKNTDAIARIWNTALKETFQGHRE